MEFWVVYEITTGKELWRGSGSEGSIYSQNLPEGTAAIKVPQKVIARVDLDLDALRTALEARVDNEAEIARLKLITPGAGQMMEYQEAVTQALAYSSNPTGSYPMLQSDVDAGTVDPRTNAPVTTIGTAADLVQFMYSQWLIAGSLIRTARLTAKKRIREATTFGHIVAAAQIDWSFLNAAPSP